MVKNNSQIDSYAGAEAERAERLLCRLNSMETRIVQVVNISLGQPLFFPAVAFAMS